MESSTQVLTTSVSDIARQLGLSERTIHRLIRSGEIASFKIGRRRLIPVERVRAWLSGMEPTKP